MGQAFDALLHLLDLEPIERNLFRGISPKENWQRVFGGQVVAQALAAATRTVAPDRLCHSFHAFFLRPGDPNVPILYQVDRLRDGKSFTTRRVVAIQHGEPIFASISSFQVEEEGFSHQAAMPTVASPDALGADALQRLARLGHLPPEAVKWMVREQPIEIRPVDAADGATLDLPVQDVWMKTTGRAPNDQALHRIVMAFASDLSLLNTACRPHGRHNGSGSGLPGVPYTANGFQLASLDHAIWFHRPFRVDEWLLYAQESPSASGGRGFNRGLIFTQDGIHVASVAQEGVMRARTKPGI